MHRIRIRYGDGKRKRIEIPIADIALAKRRAEEIQTIAQALTAAGHDPEPLLKDAPAADAARMRAIAKVVESVCKTRRAPARTLDTFRTVAQRWTSGKLARDYPDHVRTKRSAHTDASRLEALYATIGDVPIVDFTLEHAERAMTALPETTRASATRRQYAQLIAKVLKLAVYPLKLIDRTPLPSGFLPKVHGTKITAWLYPDDDQKLLACDAVPFSRRLLYGFLAREGLRLSEALGLTWSDVDLTRGIVTLDRNKTDDPRAWALSPGVANALRAARVDGRATLFTADPEHAAEVFRNDLRTAKVGRPELFSREGARRPIRVHDLRATFVTLALANGRSETWVSDRTGHKSSVMIQKYRRAARQASELALGTLAPLDVALGLGQNVGQEINAPGGSDAPIEAKNPGTEGRDRTDTPLRAVDFESDLKAYDDAPAQKTEDSDAGRDVKEHDADGVGQQVGPALARALDAAIVAGQWSTVDLIVAQIARLKV